jgi:hypothetical protein
MAGGSRSPGSGAISARQQRAPSRGGAALQAAERRWGDVTVIAHLSTDAATREPAAEVSSSAVTSTCEGELVGSTARVWAMAGRLNAEDNVARNRRIVLESGAGPDAADDRGAARPI